MKILSAADKRSSRVGAVTGFPFFEGEGGAVLGIEDDESVGLESGDPGLARVSESYRTTVGMTILLAPPNFFSRILFQGEGVVGLDDEKVVEHVGRSRKTPLRWFFHAGCSHHVLAPKKGALGGEVCVEAPVLADCINRFSVHRGCGAGSAFVEVVNKLSLVGVAPQLFAGDCIQAPNRFLSALLDSVVSHCEQATIRHRYRGEAETDFRLPCNLFEVGLPVCLVGNARAVRTEPTRPVVRGEEGNREGEK